jgi:hypothetical protein
MDGIFPLRQYAIPLGMAPGIILRRNIGNPDGRAWNLVGRAYLWLGSPRARPVRLPIKHLSRAGGYQRRGRDL